MKYLPEIAGSLFGVAVVSLVFRGVAEKTIADQIVAGIFRMDEQFASQGRNALAMLDPTAQQRVLDTVKRALVARGIEPATALNLLSESTRVYAVVGALRRTL